MNPSSPRSSASVRRRVTAGAALVSTVGMIVLILAVLFVANGTTDREMDDVLSSRIAAVRDSASIDDGKPARIDAADPVFDTLSWVADADGRLVAGPRVPGTLRAEVRRLAVSGTGPIDADVWRLAAAPLGSGADGGRVVVAIDADPYESGLARLVSASAVLGVVVVAGMTLLSGLIVRRALAPVAMMTSTADAWSHERPDRRFALGPPRDEITGLAAVLDGLLERVDGAIRTEQRLTAELAHELRTPLTVIRGEADLGAAAPRLRRADRERYERIIAAADDMGSAMTTLLDAARGSSSRAVAAVAPVLAAQAARPGLARPVVVGDVPPDLTAALPAELLGRTLAPLVDNAARYAATEVRLAATREGDRVVLRVSDDGPGIADGVGDPFAPGVREERSAGAGLGLALARRLARSAGGDAVLVSRIPAVLAVEVPAADPRPASAPSSAPDDGGRLTA